MYIRLYTYIVLTSLDVTPHFVFLQKWTEGNLERRNLLLFSVRIEYVKKTIQHKCIWVKALFWSLQNQNQQLLKWSWMIVIPCNCLLSQLIQLCSCKSLPAVHFAAVKTQNVQKCNEAIRLWRPFVINLNGVSKLNNGTITNALP